ncbi:MAG TPA: hypothetical protein DDY20_08860 [Desulfobulbaceae bacterium]|nr:hypothetical protein [Desulfobulbaceae bacterium]
MDINNVIYPFTLLPNFKGKVRILRIIHQFFSKKNNKTFWTYLNKPVRYQMNINPNCGHELMSYYMGGYEHDTVLFLDKIYDPNGYFFDIGANVGYISIPFTLMQKNKYNNDKFVTYSFEAINSNYDSLVRNIIINGLVNNVKSFRVGLGDMEKDVIIQVEGNLKDGCGTGTANILPENSLFNCERINLKITTLDSMVAQKIIPSNVTLMKLDTDGYDFFILQGGKAILKNSRPLIYGEFAKICLAWHNHKIDDVVSYMKSFDYSIFFKYPNMWKFNHKYDIQKYISDLLLIPNEQIDKYKIFLINDIF